MGIIYGYETTGVVKLSASPGRGSAAYIPLIDSGSSPVGNVFKLAGSSSDPSRYLRTYKAMINYRSVSGANNNKMAHMFVPCILLSYTKTGVATAYQTFRGGSAGLYLRSETWAWYDPGVPMSAQANTWLYVLLPTFSPALPSPITDVYLYYVWSGTKSGSFGTSTLEYSDGTNYILCQGTGPGYGDFRTAPLSVPNAQSEFVLWVSASSLNDGARPSENNTSSVIVKRIEWLSATGVVASIDFADMKVFPNDVTNTTQTPLKTQATADYQVG